MKNYHYLSIILSLFLFNAQAVELAPVPPGAVKAPMPTLQAVNPKDVKAPSVSLAAVDAKNVNAVVPTLKAVEPKDFKSGDAKLGLEAAHKDAESVKKAELGAWRFNPWR